MRRYVYAFLMLVLLAGACDSGSHKSVGSSRGTRSAKSTYTPGFETIPCSDPRVAGDDRVPTGTPNVDCGTLTIPENRSKPSRRSVVLPVAILRSTDPNKQLDPVVYFEGGPGGDGLAAIAGFLDAHLVTDRDMIFFDQRGTGKATPSLECPEVDEVTYKNLETTDPLDVEDARSVAAYRVCRARVATIADLDQYDTPTTAEDVADLRRALEVARWNIFGISYGTTVALEVLRSQPEGVRSAVIDSVFPPYVNDGPKATLDSVQRVFRTFYDGCRNDSACNARYPTLEADVTAVSDALDAHPYQLKYTDSQGTARVANLTGSDGVSGLWSAMYRSSLIPLLPSSVDQLKQGDYAVLDLVGSELLPALTSSADADYVSVECADRQQRSKNADVRSLRGAHPLYKGVLVAPFFPDICKSWNVKPVDPDFADVKATKIPTLVFGDEYDPVTPPADSAGAARRLGPKATFVEFPGLGHGATPTGPCPTKIFHAFVDAPSAKLDTSCVSQMGEPKWAI